MKRYLPAHLNKQKRRQTRWELIDDENEVIEAEEAMNNLLSDGHKGSENLFQREMLKIAKEPVRQRQAKLKERHEWEERTGKDHFRRKLTVDKFKREILASAFHRAAMSLNDDQRFLMTRDLDLKTQRADKQELVFHTSRSKGWETKKIEKILDHFAKALTKEEKEHLAPRFFERVKESLLGQVWTLSNLEEMILLDAFHYAIHHLSNQDVMKVNAMKRRETDLLEARRELSKRKKAMPKKLQKRVKKDIKGLERQYRMTKRNEARFLQNRQRHLARKEDVRAAQFELEKTPRKQTPREMKKIAKRAMTRERNERAPTPLTPEQRNHKMLKRVPITRDRAAKYITTKRAVNKSRH